MENFLHVYTGDGKGKTTSAIGLALRYLGHGGNVKLIQFMKGSRSGEIKMLENAGASIHRLSKDFGFYPFKDKEKVINEHQAMLAVAEKFSAQKTGLLILDECISAYCLSLVDRRGLLALLKRKECEIVCTGRNAPEEILKIADYITEMHSIRHPFERCIPARVGIEY